MSFFLLVDFPAFLLLFFAKKTLYQFCYSNFEARKRKNLGNCILSPIMEPSVVTDDAGASIYEYVPAFTDQGDHIKALGLIEDSILGFGKEKFHPVLYFKQGSIFKELARKMEAAEMKVTYLLGSVECFSKELGALSPFCAASLFKLGEQLGSELYYKKAIFKAKEALSLIYPGDDPRALLLLSLAERDVMATMKTEMTNLIEAADSSIVVGFPAKPEVRESKENTDTRKLEYDQDMAKDLLRFWSGLNIESKRDLMKVNTATFIKFVEEEYGKEGKCALERALKSVREDGKWKFWLCRVCSKMFFNLKKFKSHFEQKHTAKFRDPMKNFLTVRADEVWAGMLSGGDWEPLDSLAAVEMIKNQFASVKEFVYENGWSKEWPLAEDEERSKLLKEVRLQLLLFKEHGVLSCIIQDWVMSFPGKHLGKLEISEDSLIELYQILVNTPQCICFLGCDELYQILDLFKHIKCKINDGTDQVCKAVDSICNPTPVEVKISFDHDISFLLLDKRLLRCKITPFDDAGTIDVCDPNGYYAKAHVQGDDIIFWLLDYLSEDKSFHFPRSITQQNFDIWLAVMKAVEFMDKTMKTKYGKKLHRLCYDEALTECQDLCSSEDERRENLQEDQWNTYASILGEQCEERLMRGVGFNLTTIVFLAAVCDILGGSLQPTLEFPDISTCVDLMQERKNFSDDIVLKSIDHLESVISKKILLIDSKILFIENSKTDMLNSLARLAVFDYRSYILPPLKSFLLNVMTIMDAKAKSAAVEAELLLDEEDQKKTKEREKEKEKEKSRSKKKKNRSNKRISRTLSSPLHQNVEHEPSANTKPELKLTEEDSMQPEDSAQPEDSMRPEDTLASEMSELEISFNTDNQEEATKDLQTMIGEDSIPEHLEAVPREIVFRYDTALDMTLKALLNIKVIRDDMVHNQEPVLDNQKEQYERLYSYLLNDLRASLEEVLSMQSDAVDVLIAILELWKSPEREGSGTYLFTLEEEESVSCSKCSRKPNYPKQTSYGIVADADSIRYLKSNFGNMKFEDILKVNSMEEKILCDIKTGGCGKRNFSHRIISRRPPILTIAIEWETDETEKEITATTKALVPEINISKLNAGLEPNANYRLASMVVAGEEEYTCITYEKEQWVKHDSLTEEIVGRWESVLTFCGEKKVRPEVLFFEAV